MTENEKVPWYEVLQRIDRRIIYLIVLALCSVPFFIPIPVAMEVSPPVQSLFDKIEQIAEQNKSGKEQFVLLAMDWSPSVKAENEPQTAAIIEHMFRKNVRFIILSFYLPEGPRMTETLAEELAKKYDKRYGVDWVNIGYKQVDLPAYLSFIRDMYSIIEKDYRGTPIRDVPMMKKVGSLRDVSLVFEATGSAGYGIWVIYAQPEIRTLEVGVGVTAIVGPSIRPFIDSRQIIGMLEGLSGAAQYEQLLKTRGNATRGMGSQNLAHLWIIVTMALGNIGYFLSKRRERNRKKEVA
jgi:hypothetical protein